MLFFNHFPQLPIEFNQGGVHRNGGFQLDGTDFGFQVCQPGFVLGIGEAHGG